MTLRMLRCIAVFVCLRNANKTSKKPGFFEKAGLLATVLFELLRNRGAKGTMLDGARRLVAKRPFVLPVMQWDVTLVGRRRGGICGS